MVTAMSTPALVSGAGTRRVGQHAISTCSGCRMTARGTTTLGPSPAWGTIASTPATAVAPTSMSASMSVAPATAAAGPALPPPLDRTGHLVLRFCSVLGPVLVLVDNNMGAYWVLAPLPFTDFCCLSPPFTVVLLSFQAVQSGYSSVGMPRMAGRGSRLRNQTQRRTPAASPQPALRRTHPQVALRWT